MVKKKKKASEKAIASTKHRIIDYKKENLDQFYSESKGKFLWMCFNEICYVRVKVLEIGKSTDYENVLVKIVKLPLWMKRVFGSYMTEQRSMRDWTTVKKGTKVWANALSLYRTPNIMKFVNNKKTEIMENIVASKKQLEFSQQSLDILKSVEEAFEKAPDYPKEEK